MDFYEESLAKRLPGYSEEERQLVDMYAASCVPTLAKHFDDDEIARRAFDLAEAMIKERRLRKI